MGNKEIEESRFTVTNLGDGQLVELLNDAVRTVALDVKNRPEIEKPRKIVWEIQMMPTKEGDFVRVAAERPKITLPKGKAISTICGMPDSEGNLRNLTISSQKSLPINITMENEE